MYPKVSKNDNARYIYRILLPLSQKAGREAFDKVDPLFCKGCKQHCTSSAVRPAEVAAVFATKLGTSVSTSPCASMVGWA